RHALACRRDLQSSFCFEALAGASDPDLSAAIGGDLPSTLAAERAGRYDSTAPKRHAISALATLSTSDLAPRDRFVPSRQSQRYVHAPAEGLGQNRTSENADLSPLPGGKRALAPRAQHQHRRVRANLVGLVEERGHRSGVRLGAHDNEPYRDVAQSQLGRV